MRFGKALWFAGVAMLLAAYAFDCDAMATAEQAMQCCGSMPCSHQGHQEQDCCKTMPTMHGAFVKPAAMKHQETRAVAVVVLAEVRSSEAVPPGDRMKSAVSQAPPIFSPPNISPLRI